MGGWTEYRIDIVRTAAGTAFFNPGRDKKQAFATANQPLTIASDGTRVWQVFPERVITGPAAPPPGDLAALVDASWLLDRDLELSGGTEVWADGRPAMRQELRDFTALAAGTDFGFTPPAGLPVIDAESRQGESEEGTWTWSWDPPH